MLLMIVRHFKGPLVADQLLEYYTKSVYTVGAALSSSNADCSYKRAQMVHVAIV